MDKGYKLFISNKHWLAQVMEEQSKIHLWIGSISALISSLFVVLTYFKAEQQANLYVVPETVNLVAEQNPSESSHYQFSFGQVELAYTSILPEVDLAWFSFPYPYIEKGELTGKIEIANKLNSEIEDCSLNLYKNSQGSWQAIASLADSAHFKKLEKTTDLHFYQLKKKAKAFPVYYPNHPMEILRQKVSGYKKMALRIICPGQGRGFYASKLYEIKAGTSQLSWNDDDKSEWKIIFWAIISVTFLLVWFILECFYNLFRLVFFEGPRKLWEVIKGK